MSILEVTQVLDSTHMTASRIQNDEDTTVHCKALAKPQTSMRKVLS